MFRCCFCINDIVGITFTLFNSKYPAELTGISFANPLLSLSYTVLSLYHTIVQLKCNRLDRGSNFTK